jgi:hypothetical protein
MPVSVRYRHIVAQVAIMSVILHAIMASFMLPMPSAIVSSAEPSAVVICTGTNLIAFDENGNQIEKQMPGKPCPICNGIATSAFLLEMAPTALIGRLTNPEVLRPAIDPHPSSIARLANRSRGPPALA